MSRVNLAAKVRHLLDDGAFDYIINEIKNDIALEIVNSQTQDVEKREDLYMLAQALKCLNGKLQEYANIEENFNLE